MRYELWFVLISMYLYSRELNNISTKKHLLGAKLKDALLNLSFAPAQRKYVFTVKILDIENTIIMYGVNYTPTRILGR